MKLIKDLGVFPEKNYKRFGIFECQGCNREFNRQFTPKEFCMSCSKTTHGDRNERLYKIYLNIKQRCFNENNCNYHRYGDRRITICEDWKNSYIVFKEWALSNGYSKELSIDRINNNGDYEPINCRWATMEAQGRNRGLKDTNKSGYIGVSWCKQTSKWKSAININGKSITLLRHTDKILCAKTRDKYIRDNSTGHILNFK